VCWCVPQGGSVVINLDGDAAGEQAVRRACSQVLMWADSHDKLGALEVKIAALPPGYKDANDYFQVTGEGWRFVSQIRTFCVLL
jgi:DNA primase